MGTKLLNEGKFGAVLYEGKKYLLQQNAHTETAENARGPREDGEEYTLYYVANAVLAEEAGEEDPAPYRVVWAFRETKGSELGDEGDYDWDGVANVERR